jgi:hypothetical protein
VDTGCSPEAYRTVTHAASAPSEDAVVPRRASRAVEVAALAAALFPIVHLRWRAPALTLPALLVAALADRVQQPDALPD